jgi:hypothetical protein
MKRLLAAVLSISALTIGCRSVPIAVPDLPAEQLLVNQPTFENAVQQKISESCIKGKVAGPRVAIEPLGKSVLCDMTRLESGAR